MDDSRCEYPVERLLPPQFTEAVTVLRDAFRDAPALMSILRGVGQKSRDRKLKVMFREVVHAAARRSHVLGITLDGSVAAVAIFHPPGAYPPPLLTQLTCLGRTTLKTGPRGLLRFIRWTSQIDRHQPAFPHFHLEVLGVTPECHGRGLGSAMLQEIVSIADAENTPCFLETADQRTVKLYHQFGFEVVDEDDILDIHLWFMVRQPDNQEVTPTTAT